MIRVRVKTSSPIARKGLETLLRGHPHFALVGDSFDDASELESEPAQDVLVVEAESLDDHTAREAMDWASTGGSVVVLVRNHTPDAAAELLRVGVKAVLPSNLEELQIIAAIEAAAAGLTVLDGPDVEAILGAGNPPFIRAAGTPIESLTPRETEVLKLVTAGLGNKEIASRLEISEHTVKFHVASIMGKLGASSRTEAVTLGVRHGLIMI